MIGHPPIFWFCRGMGILLFCLDLFSPFRSAQGSRVRGSLWTKLHSALPPLSLPLSSSTSSSPCCHLLSPFACSLSPLISPAYALRTPTLYFYSLPPLLPPILSSPPPSYLHLLSQGPCGTLRGWWGWGWWWCRWWWNSHSVSSLPVLEPDASPYSSLSLPTHSSLVSERKGWGWGVRRGGRLPVFATVSSTHLYAAHPTITPHMPPVFVCLQPVCFLCHYYCLVWSV